MQPRPKCFSFAVQKYLENKYGYNSEEQKEVVFEAVADLVGKKEGVECFISTEDISFVGNLIHKHYETIKENLNQNKKEKEEGKKKDLTKLFKGINVKKELNDARKQAEKENGIIIPAIIDLFGRMSTSDVIKSVDSSIEVANAMSTHEVVKEWDYFTAVDDIAEKELNGGAAHLDQTEFNSSCYYGYVKFSINQFCKNLNENVFNEEYKEKALKGVVDALLTTICFDNPETKKTGFAYSAVPECLLVVVKNKDRRMNLANAFANAIEYENGNLIKKSVEKLSNEYDGVKKAYGTDDQVAFWLAPKFEDITPISAEKITSLNELIEKIGVYIE